jgi:Carboxypeptidase regulatory-like domain
MAMTRPDGRYTLTALRPGRYTLHYSDCSAPGRYLDQWSGGKFVPDGASRIVVTAGRVRNAGRVTLRATSSTPAGVNFAAPNPAPALPGPTHAGTSASTPGTGAIAGKVTGRGKPLKGICVDAFPRRGGRGARVKTTKSGTYRVGSLKPGRYLVVFFDCTRKTNWLGQYYRGVEFYSSHRRPTAVPVRAGKTTRGINAKLELGGEIDGTVRNKDGQPLPRICAEAIGRIGKRFVFGGYRATDANGRYVLHGVTPASYQVHFSRCGNPGNYAPVWWRHSQTMAGATKIVIKSGQIVQHIDPVMPAGGVISGTVRAVGPSGKRLRGICVFAEGRSVFSFALTNRSGNYRLIGLTSGKYRLFFQRCRNRGNYLPTRRSVKAILGHTVSVDAFLPLGAIGTGVVTDSQGDPIAGICVEFQGHRSFGGTRTRSDGTYSVNALRSGPYKIQFTGGCGNSGSYAPQFYRGATNVAAAKQIDLTAGKTTRRINASMRPGATIAGTVTDAAGNRVNDLCISIVPLASLPGGFDFRNLTFAYRGAYAAENLAPGTYAVNFGCFYGGRQLAVQWFMGQPGPGSANPVSAPAGVVTSGIDATLQQNGSITGTVTNRSGTPLAGICVEARAAGSSGTEFFFGQTFTVTRKNGTYSLSRVPPGSYVIQYVDCRHRTYGSRWYKQKASPQTGTPVTVTPGGTASGIDETLALGGSISGVVKTSSGMPVRACVEAFDATTESDGFVLADRTGHYTIKGLSTGSYQVAFFPCERSATPLAETMRPMPVAVKAPAAVTGINGKLGVAGSISGAVRDGAGKLQAGVCIAAVPADPGNGIAIAETGQDGTYEIGHLGAGTYHVYLGDAFCGSGSSGHVFAPQWFKGQQSLATATDVTVTAGNATADISAGLGEGGTIRGTVTHQGQPVAGECVTAAPVNPTPDPLLNQTLNPVVAVTTSSGSYSLVDLLPGQYDVKFSIGCGDSGFATQWWRHAASEQSATTISVSANGTVTGIDANLP